MFKFIQNLLKNITNLVKDSSISDNKLSSTRLSAYAILIGVMSMVFVALGVEVSSAVAALATKHNYVLSNEFIIVLGSLLTHHLTLLGVNKYHETKSGKSNTSDSGGDNTNTTEPEVK